MTARRGSLSKQGIAASDDVIITGIWVFGQLTVDDIFIDGSQIISLDDTLVLFGGDPDKVSVQVRGLAAQTQPIFQVVNNASAQLFVILGNGNAQFQAEFADFTLVGTGALFKSGKFFIRAPDGVQDLKIITTNLTAQRTFTIDVRDASRIFTLTADFVAPVVARTTADQSFNLTTTLADVTGLTAALKANGVYKVRAVLFASVGGGGLQAALNDATGAADIQYVTAVIQTTGMSNVQRRTAYDVGTGSSSASVIMITIEGYIKNNATPGTLAVRAAQEMSSGTDSDILEGSTLEVQEIV